MNLMIIYHNLQVKFLQLAQIEDIFTQDAIAIFTPFRRFRLQIKAVNKKNVLSILHLLFKCFSK